MRVATAMQTPVVIVVLANDVDADGDALTVTGVGVPAHGTAVGEFERRPSPTRRAWQYGGPDGFTYSISDGQGATATATVAVNVAGVLRTCRRSVDAGPDQALTFPTATATLSGTASDDGVPHRDPDHAVVEGQRPGHRDVRQCDRTGDDRDVLQPGSYVLQLSASDGLLSSADTIAVTVVANPSNKAIDFGGTNAYVTFGAGRRARRQMFTIETWFRRDGAGIATNTGTGGVVAVPLVTKGMAETEGGTVDMDYFLGIRGSDGVLVGDFEDTATGLNHPVAGATVIAADGVWHHGAATYDGTTWRLYLDGALRRSSSSARSRRSSTASSTRRSAPR